MSHPQQQQFIASLKERYPDWFHGKRVLEIGSLNINGTVRDYFTDCFYVGVDIAAGPCVDLVSLGHELDFPDESFDVVISCECMEHNPYWLETFTNMIRMSRRLVIMTCATTGRAEHGTTRSAPDCSPLTVQQGWEYYQNLTQEDFEILPIDLLFKEHQFITNNESNDLYFYGWRI